MTQMEVVLTEIAKLELNDRDILLVRVPPSYSPEKQSIVNKVVHDALSRVDKRVQVLIGTTDIDFTIVRKSEDEERE